MTRIDELLGDVFADMVAEVEPVDFVTRARAASHRIRNRRRVVASAAAIALIASVGATFVARRSAEIAAKPAVLSLDALEVRTPERLTMVLSFDLAEGRFPGSGIYVGRDAATGAFFRLPLGAPNVNDPLASYSLTNDGKSVSWAATTGGTDVRTLSTGALSHIQAEPCPGQEVSGLPVDLSPDGKRYALEQPCSHSSNVLIFATATRRALIPAIKLSAFDVDTYHPSPMKWSPDGRLLAILAADGTVIVDTASGQIIRRFTDRSSFQTWSPDSRRLVGRTHSGDVSRTAVLDVVDGSITSLKAPDAPVSPLIFPLGWDSADRVVWGTTMNHQPVGAPAGDNVLVAVDIDGKHPREWLRITGQHTLDLVEWTARLTR